MKKLTLLLFVLLLSGCTQDVPATYIEMEMTENYDTTDPFIHEKLIYVDEDIEAVELNIAFQMEGESGVLEIIDCETTQAVWSDQWEGAVKETAFTVPLDCTQKEFLIRFTGTKIKYAKVVITSENNLVKEREKPLKPDRAAPAAG